MTARGTITAVVAGAAIALMVACGARASHPLATRPTSDAGPPLGGRPDELRAQITALDERIAVDRATLGTDAPEASATAAMAGVTADDAALTCVRSTRETCVDVCKLGDSICANATSICELAAQLPGDAWAEERCNAGKASCKTGSERCCDC